MTGQTGATAVLRHWCHWAAPSLTPNTPIFTCFHSPDMVPCGFLCHDHVEQLIIFPGQVIKRSDKFF